MSNHRGNDPRMNDVLEAVYREAPRAEIGERDKYVIFSDLHMGNGSGTDDFELNSRLFADVLQQHYLPSQYTLVLNGDIEELQKFRIQKVRRRWGELYSLFSSFERAGGLIKIIGNHDAELALKNTALGRTDGRKDRLENGDLHEAFCLSFKGKDILLFHGHQASKYFQRYNKLSGWILRYIVRPLRIKNYSVSHDSRKQFITERRVYDFSRAKKIISIIGHTHRPLFESLSKADSLKYRIEHALRRYAQCGGEERKRIGEEVRRCREELDSVYAKHPEYGLRSGLYNREIIVPSLFNSGCVIGKRGITGIEIADGKISLVHWFDKSRSIKYFNYDGLEPERLEGTDYYRMVLKEDFLEYIFARIELLA